MENQVAQIEVSTSNGTKDWLNVNYEKISEGHMENLFSAGLFREISATAKKTMDQPLSGRVQVMSAKPLDIGQSLSVAMQDSGDSLGVTALAVVVNQIHGSIDGAYSSAIRFTGLSQKNTAKIQNHAAARLQHP